MMGRFCLDVVRSHTWDIILLFNTANSELTLIIWLPWKQLHESKWFVIISPPGWDWNIPDDCWGIWPTLVRFCWPIWLICCCPTMGCCCLPCCCCCCCCPARMMVALVARLREFNSSDRITVCLLWSSMPTRGLYVWQRYNHRLQSLKVYQ